MAAGGELALILGVLSGLSWGTGDFIGGVASRRANPFSVALTSQLVGGALIALIGLATREALPPARDWGWAAAAGVSGGMGLLLLYRGLAGGRMGIIAPISGVVAALVPIVVAAFTVGLPGPLQLAGFGLAMAAVWLLTAHEDGRPHPRELVLPVVAGLGFGLFYVFLDRANDHSIYWSLVVQRCVAASVVVIAAFIADQSLWPPRGARGLIGAVGFFDVGGNVFFSLAALAGRLDVAAVLSSLYPGATVAWASLLLRERLSRPQWAGVAAALAAIVFIAL